MPAGLLLTAAFESEKTLPTQRLSAWESVMHQSKYSCIFGCVLSLAAAGCFKATVPSGSQSPNAPDSGKSGGEPIATAGRGGNKPPRASTNTKSPDDMTSPLDPDDPRTGHCIRGGYCTEVETRIKRAADLLFVVDDSGSMSQEQAALRDQFPLLITSLTNGRTSSGAHFPALTDLHLGVVSTDMGLAGIANNYPGCNTARHVRGGDDGILLHPGVTGPGCNTDYPAFLTYTEGRDDSSKLATDFGCISSLGTAGCGFEQQLEAGLKALWPKNYMDLEGNVYPPEKNPILFLSTTAEGRYGHGDVPAAEGGNGGFLRPDALLAIVVVTDEEDCSSKNTSHFVSTNDPSNPLSKQGINLRCYYNKQNLFEIDRYTKGYAGLKPGHEQDVLFAAIVGVPVELVSEQARAEVDFSDQEARDAYYDRILADERMLERPQNENIPAIANVAPSCTRTDRFGQRADAYPPRRIVEVAKGMGQNATVQSICQDDFGPAMNGILELTRSRAQVECLPREFDRNSKRKIDCELIWELPPTDSAGCSAFPYLSEVSRPRSDTNDHGGHNCLVAQLPVTSLGQVPSGEGFYYDDFTAERENDCRGGATSRIAYTPGIEVPVGVRTFLDCASK
jgi:hypothetical protein